MTSLHRARALSVATMTRVYEHVGPGRFRWEMGWPFLDRIQSELVEGPAQGCERARSEREAIRV
jgi:hypothetical protein